MLENQTIDWPAAEKTAPLPPPTEPSRNSVRKGGAPVAGSTRALFPIMGVVLVAFLVIGLALPVLPLHVHLALGLSTFVVGLVTGSQFIASLISRVCAGHYADRKCAKRAVIV